MTVECKGETGMPLRSRGEYIFPLLLTIGEKLDTWDSRCIQNTIDNGDFVHAMASHGKAFFADNIPIFVAMIGVNKAAKP